MTEKVDVSGIFAYNTSLDDMDFRCSNAVTVLAVLMGSGACFFFAPSACAGDRIDFSAPAIPLGVPKQEVEIKEPAKILGTRDVSDGLMSGMEMAPSAQYYIVKPKNRDKNDWGLNPRLDENPDRIDSDDWSVSRPDPTRSTNSNSLNMKPGSNPNTSDNLFQQRNESGLDGGQNSSRFGQNGVDGENSRFGAQFGLDSENSRFGEKNGLGRNNPLYDTKNGSEKDYSRYDARTGLDKEYERSSDRLARESSSSADGSFWSKTFGHDTSSADRFNATHLMPSMSDAKEFNGGALEDRMSNSGLGPDSAHPAALSPDWAGFTPQDNGQSRQIGEQIGEGSPSFRAWEPAASPIAPSRNFSNPEQNNSSRVVAPNRPTILPWAARPGNPY